MTTTSKVQLKRQLNLLHAISIIAGCIIGSGIFISPVGILMHVQSPGLSFIMWILSGLFSALAAICYAELGIMIPKSGGEYVYILEAFGQLPAFICLWVYVIMVTGVASGASAIIFATYVLKPLFADCAPPDIAVRLLSGLSIVFLTLINNTKVSWVAKLQVTFLVSKLLASALVIVLGMVHLAKGHTGGLQAGFQGSQYSPGSITLAFYSGFWAYGGWNCLNFLLDELRDPVRNLPRAIFGSMTIVTSVYVLANVAYLAVLTPAQMLHSPAVGVTFAGKTMGQFAPLMPLLISISVLGSMNGSILALSRLLYSAARNGHFPQVLGMITYDQMVPTPALCTMAIVALIFQSVNDIFYLIEMMGFCFSVILSSAIGSLLVLKWKNAFPEHPMQLPFALPLVMFILSVSIVGLTCYQKPHESLISVIIMLCAIPIYMIGVAWKRKPRSLLQVFDKVTHVLQKVMMVVLPDEDDSVSVCE